MNIGKVAQVTGLPVKTVRYYEEIGLVRPTRSENGYRVFADADLHKLNFLGRSRALGFSIEDCRALLALYEDGTRPSSEVREIAERHLAGIEGKISDLQLLRDTLARLIASCAGDARPDCPILDNLSRG